jgi:hypothetical protein
MEPPGIPGRFSERKPSAFVGTSLLDPKLLSSAITLPIARVQPRTFLENGPVRVRFHIGDLRQHGNDRSDELRLLVRARPEDGVLHGTWTATIRDQEGVLTGIIDVLLAEKPVDVAALISAETEGAEERG